MVKTKIDDVYFVDGLKHNLLSVGQLVYKGYQLQFGNDVAYHITWIRSITLDGKTKIDDVYFVDGLKHNLLSVGKLVDKGY